jgi:acyl-CoA hydrolase
VARLRHLDIDARALRLIELAAPQCREALGQAWTLMRRRLYGCVHAPC